MLQFSHILWDWNGTLLDDSDMCVATLNSVLTEHGLAPIELEHYREIFQFPVHRFYRTLDKELCDHTLKSMSSQFVTNYEEVWRDCSLQAEAISILNHFQGHGIRQNILSASNQSTLNSCLEHYQLEQYFESIIGQDNCHAHGKLETAQCWLSQTQAEPQNVLLIGDTLHDLEIANELGFGCALFARGHNSESRLRKAHSWVIQDLSDLQQIAQRPASARKKTAPR